MAPLEAFLRRPFLFLLFPCVAGVVLGRYLGYEIPHWSYLPFLLLAFLLSFLKRPEISIPFLAFSLFLLAYGGTRDTMDPTFPEDHIIHFAGGDYTILEGKVYRVEEFLTKERLYIDVDRVLLEEERPATGRLLLTVGGGDNSFSVGQRVRFRAKLRRPRNFGNPGGFDYEGYLASKGIYVTAYAGERGWVVPVGGGDSFLEGIRKDIGLFIDRVDPPLRGVVKALVLGERGEVERDTRDLFIRTGTAHLLAISGLHVGIIASTFYGLLLFFFKRWEYLLLSLDVKRLSALLTIPPVVFYSLIGGLSIPTQRALIFAIVFLLAVFSQRERDYWNLLSFAALILLLLNPLLLFQVSFQLSFVAVASILLFFHHRKGGFRGWLRDLLLISLVTFAGTAPLLLYHFHRLSTIGVIANILAVPLIGFLSLPFLLLAGLLSLVSYGLASYPLLIGVFWLKMGMMWLSFLSSFPFSSLYLPSLSLTGMVLYYISFIGISGIRRYGRMALLLSMPFVFWLLSLPISTPERVLRVTFISVGPGDATLIEFPNGEVMLVDGGGGFGKGFDIGERVIGPFLLERGVKRIDYMVLTHPQRDHMEGLFFVAKNFEIGRFLWNGRGLQGEGLLSVLREREVPVMEIDSSMPPLWLGGVRIEVLHPGPGSLLEGRDGSLVLRLDFGKVSILLPGDIGEGVERSLLQRGLQEVTILKVPGHGAISSSSPPFIRAISPEVAIISAGHNDPFHPHSEVLRRYRNEGVRLYRTDRDGAITVVTDGRGYTVKTFR